MPRKIRVERLFTSSCVCVTGGQSVISINGRIYRVDAEDVVSVRVVSDGPDARIEVTDKHGRTRRVDCGE